MVTDLRCHIMHDDSTHGTQFAPGFRSKFTSFGQLMDSLGSLIKYFVRFFKVTRIYVLHRWPWCHTLLEPRSGTVAVDL